VVVDTGAARGAGGVEGTTLGVVEVMGTAREAAELGEARGRRG
jgi:flagellar motor component MotA